MNLLISHAAARVCVHTMTKTDMAWVLSFGFLSKGTSESRRKEKRRLADGAISKILIEVANRKHYRDRNIQLQKQCVCVKFIRGTYFRKNLNPRSAASFFIALQDLSTSASCSSVNTIGAVVFAIFLSLSLSLSVVVSSPPRKWGVCFNAWPRVIEWMGIYTCICELLRDAKRQQRWNGG